MKHVTRNKRPAGLFRDTGYVLRVQAGQTLIETIVAIFVLVTALTTGLGLAIYALSSARTSQAEIIASNLAREGIDVFRMMRDSNWLAADVYTDPNFHLQDCVDIASKKCYPQAYGGPAYQLGNGNQRVIFNPNVPAWGLESISSYFLYLQADGTYTHTANSTTPTYARMINVTYNSAAPYTPANSEVIVKSIVAWKGKNCTDFTTSTNLLLLSTSCKVTVEEHLTNWKDYQ